MTDDPADVDLVNFAEEQPVPEAEVRRRPPLVPLAIGVVLVLTLAGTYMYLRTPADPAGAPAAAVEPSKRDPSAERGEEIVLPPLDQTDALVRDLVGKLSSYPVIAAWLTTDGLILNFAAVTSRVANHDQVAQELRAIGPVPPFRPRVSRDRLFLDPSSYKRYDRYSAAVSSIDSRGAAQLYATLKPRILDASKRIDPTAPEFDSVMERAFVDLLRVPIVEGEIELVPQGMVYGFADPRLEELSPAQKHLLRMGPQNVQVIQKKLREIADYLGIPASRLPPASR